MISASYTPSPTAETFIVKYGFKEWLINNIRSPQKHTQPHSYRFKKKEDGTVGVCFKRFAMDEEWLETDRPLLSHMPEGQPGIVKPTWEKQLEMKELRDRIANFKFYFSSTQLNEWRIFIDDLEKRKKYVNIYISIDTSVT